MGNGRLSDATVEGHVHGTHKVNLNYGNHYARGFDGTVLDKDGKIGQSWLNSKPYVSNNLIGILLEAPGYLDLFDDRIERLKEFIVDSDS